MKKVDDDEGYGNCDEIDGPDECEGCNTPATERTDHAFTPVEPESMKTQTVRIRVTDLATLQTLKEHDDETPGGVMHRVLEGYGMMFQAQSENGGNEETLKKYETLIAKQKEKITTQRREIDEQRCTVDVLNSALADNNEENLAKFQDQREAILEVLRECGRMIAELEDELDEMRDIESEHICVGSGTTININVFRRSRAGEELCNDTR